VCVCVCVCVRACVRACVCVIRKLIMYYYFVCHSFFIGWSRIWCMGWKF